MNAENEKKSVQLTENQLLQMARQEENELANKKAILQQIGGILGETIMAKEALKELKNAKGKMLVSVGATILIEVGVENTKTVKRGISEDGYKEENIEDSIKWLEEKEAEIKKRYEKLQAETSQSNTRLTEIVGILKQIETEKKKAASRAPPMISK